MRFVIYDDESLEPITVLNLPFTYHEMDDRMRERGRRWRVPVPMPLPPRQLSDADIALRSTADFQVADLEFEPFIRRSERQGEQRSWMCFTRATELAMLLNPDWLPGQRGAVNALMNQNDQLTTMLMAAMLR